jgi:chromate transporter
MQLWDLFRAFFVIGATTFGGGYAMLPMLTREIVNKRKWATDEELLDYFAIGQCIPGIIAINTSTFIGHKKRGVAGAVVATLGMIAPSLIIIVFIAMLLSNFMEIEIIQHAFAGIRVAVGALIVSTVIKLVKSNVKNVLQISLCVLVFLAVAILKVSPMWIVIVVVAIGILQGRIGAKVCK